MIRITAAAIAAVLTLAIGPASAQEAWTDHAFTCRAYRADLYWHRWAREHCRDYRWRWRRYHRSHQWQPVNPDGVVCHGFVPAVGEQAQSEEAAWEAAIVAWRGRVRWLHGERFTDHQAARNLIKACAPSSVPDAYRDQKLPPLYRCEMQARPCRAVPRKVDREDD